MSGEDSSGPYAPVIQDLVSRLAQHGDSDKLDAAIEQAIAYDIRDIAVLGLVDTPSFLRHANYLVTTWVPSEEKEGKDIYYDLVVFYFIFNQPALKGLQNPISPDSYNQPLTYLSEWLVDFAKTVGQNLDQESSLTPASLQSFRDSPKYNVDKVTGDYLEPRGGWKTFNDFFARVTKPGKRPVASLCDPTVVTSPADFKFNENPDGTDPTSWPVSADSSVVIKGIKWNIQDLLQGSQYADKFAGGTFTHAFLNTYSYHRQHAPVDGKVVEARVIEGQVYLETTVVEINGQKSLQAVRRTTGQRTNSFSPQTVNAPDEPGYQFLQTRGLIVLDTNIGYVAVLPIGMAQVSSVILTAEVGVSLRKGEEISYFQFGGSDCVIVFQEAANFKIIDKVQPGTAVKMGEQIGTAQLVK